MAALISAPIATRGRKKWTIILLLLLLLLGVVYLFMRIRGFPAPATVPFFQKESLPLNIAHRGFPSREPENSLPSFRSALEHGADILELDIFLTQDNAIVVHHDRNLRRTTGLDRDITTADLGEIQALDAGYGFRKRSDEDRGEERQSNGKQLSIERVTIPTLKEVFAAFPQSRVNIEIKDSPRLEETARRLWELIRNMGRESSVLVASGQQSALSAFRKFSRGRVATGASLREALLFYGSYLLRIPTRPDFNALQIPANAGMISLDSPQFIQFAHAHGLKVHYWTIDDPKEMESLLAAGADGIMTNRTDLAEQAIKESVALKSGRKSEQKSGQEKHQEKDSGGDSNGGDGGEDSSGGDSSERPPAILFLGDSLTAGYGLAAEEAAPALIERHIQKSNLNYRVINAGRSGDTTLGAITRLEWYLKPQINIQHLIIWLGANDAMQGIAIKQVKENLEKIIGKVRSFDPRIRLYIVQMYTFPNMGQQYTRRFGRIFQEVANQQKIVLLPFPLQGVAARPELNQADGIHPTVEGTQIVAKNIWQALKEHL